MHIPSGVILIFKQLNVCNKDNFPFVFLILQNGLAAHDVFCSIFTDINISKSFSKKKLDTNSLFETNILKISFPTGFTRT